MYYYYYYYYYYYLLYSDSIILYLPINRAHARVTNLMILYVTDLRAVRSQSV
jgi:hypothetical protein